MNEREINGHWEYTHDVIRLSEGKITIKLCEYLYKQAMRHGVKHEQDGDGFELDIMKLAIDICSICTKKGVDGVCKNDESYGCDEFQHFMYRDM